MSYGSPQDINRGAEPEKDPIDPVPLLEVFGVVAIGTGLGFWFWPAAVIWVGAIALIMAWRITVDR